MGDAGNAATARTSIEMSNNIGRRPLVRVGDQYSISNLINELDPEDDFDPRSGSRKVLKAAFENDRNADDFTQKEEAAVLRKLDVRVVLLMGFLYLLAFIDRSSLTEDLNLRDDQFDWLLTGFYLTYITFQWTIMLYHLLTPHIYVAVCVFSWGLIASLQSMATGFWSLFALRALLGVGEAAFSPGVPLYLSYFYRREELAFRTGIQVSAAPLASSFAGTLAYLITRFGEYTPFAPWRLLFLVEGLPSVLIAVLCYHTVADSAGTAKFLTPRERKIATRRLQTDHASEQDVKASKRSGVRSIDWREMRQTLRDPKCYMIAVCTSISLQSSLLTVAGHVLPRQHRIRLDARLPSHGHSRVSSSNTLHAIKQH
ncbi:hypothetical protein MRB53_037805 [Persea americana]|nr:hypothetical protein MRB53_037805 [Persea americana]